MPRPLSFMSGNFDDPPSSDSYRETAERIVREVLDSTQSPDDISPSGELYRAIERFHRRRRPENRNNTLPSIHTMASEPDPERRRRLQREGQDFSSYSSLFPSSSELQSDATVVEPNPRERVHARLYAAATNRRARLSQRIPLPPSDRYMERHRAVLGESSASNGLSELHNAGRQLEEASSNLRALLDDPVPSISTPTLEADDVDRSRRAAKRRKLDSDRPEPGFTSFKYGKYGQEEPGKLNMEIVSCDGGIFTDPSGNYAAENVLKNDTSVYCTKANRCNLVLRHQGGTVFCLKELIIKAPHSGYTAPVQEGMVFISMTSDDLLTRTAKYQIQYSPARSGRPGSSRSDEVPPIRSVRHNQDGTMTESQVRARRLYNIGLEDDDCEYRTAQLPSDFIENAPPFQVTTELDDSENDDPATQRNARNRIIHRVMGLRFEDDATSNPSSNDEESDSHREGPASAWHEDYLLNLGRSPRLLRRRETASNITLSEAQEASQVATQEAVKAVGGELMAPHARFFIERDKSKCTVTFDPPVSGRFILLKMWSPHHSATSNIDIQSVVATGFAGPRFFPAFKWR